MLESLRKSLKDRLRVKSNIGRNWEEPLNHSYGETRPWRYASQARPVKLLLLVAKVLSDPVADKVQFLKPASQSGYYVGLIFIRIPSVATSQERVSMHSAQGGHDVPDQKLKDRFSRTLANLKRAIDALPLVIIYDNSDLSSPFQLESVWVGVI